MGDNWSERQWANFNGQWSVDDPLNEHSPPGFMEGKGSRQCPVTGTDSKITPHFKDAVVSHPLARGFSAMTYLLPVARCPLPNAGD